MPEHDTQDRLDLAVVIVNHRTPQLVIDCLGTLVPQLGPGQAAVVVDNASGDDSVDRLAAWIAAAGAGERVVLHPSQVNGGFSAGNNLAIRHVDADTYLLLNSDTLVRPGAIARLMATLREHPEAGIVSPRLEWPDGTPQISCFRWHTPISEFIRGANTGPITRLLRRWEVWPPVSDQLTRPQWTTFAAAAIRKAVLDRVGLLDEGFFLYFDDAEFCRRCRAAGWEVVNDPAARIVHLRGQSTQLKAMAAARERLPKYYYESRARYFYLAYGRAGLLAANACWLAGRSIAFARELVERRASHVAQREGHDILTTWHVGPRERHGG